MGYKIALAEINCLNDSFLKGYFLQEGIHMQPNHEAGAVETVHRDSSSNVSTLPLVVRVQVIMVIYKITRDCLLLTLKKKKAFFPPFKIKEILESY